MTAVTLCLWRAEAAGGWGIKRLSKSIKLWGVSDKTENRVRHEMLWNEASWTTEKVRAQTTA